MPVPKRYFKVSQEINHDPEMWEMTETFGDRALRIWLELLSSLDRNHNQYKVSGLWVSQLANATKTNLKTVLQVVLWIIGKEWLHVSGDAQLSEDWLKTGRRLAGDLPESHRRMIEDWLKNGQRLSLCASNWAKYNRTPEHKGIEKVPVSLPSYPTPTPTPSLTSPKDKSKSVHEDVTPHTNKVVQSEKRKKRSLRSIQDSDAPTEKHRALAAQLKVDIGPEWAKFKNNCLAHDKRYADFEAAFRNWIVRSEEFKGVRRVL